MINNEIKFLIEIDKLKSVYRKTSLIGGERKENSAEHSWHLMMAVLSLSHNANFEIDLTKALKMAFVHDIVEIYAGDIMIYEAVDSQKVYEDESRALEKIFQPIKDLEVAKELCSLWHEFEKEQSNESLFVKAVDRFLPILINCQNKGGSWVEHKITYDQVISKNSKIKKGSVILWEKTLELLDEAVSKGFLLKNS